MKEVGPPALRSAPACKLPAALPVGRLRNSVAARAQEERSYRADGGYERASTWDGERADSRQTSGRSATFSGRWDGRWAETQPGWAAGRQRQAQTWGRPMPSGPRPAGDQRWQRGPIQPAVWSDSPPQDAAQRRQTTGKGQEPAPGPDSHQPAQPAGRPTPAAAGGAQTPAAAEGAGNGRFARPEGESSERVGTAAAAAAGGPDIPTWPPMPGRASSSASQPAPSREPSSQQRFNGAPSPGAAEPAQAQPYGDDWAGYEPPVSDIEDGWGGRQPGPAAAQQPRFGGGDRKAPRDGRAAWSGPDAELLEEEEEGVDEDDPEAYEEAEWGWEGDGGFPDITALAPAEVDELLPLVPTPEQMGASWGSAVDVWQRLGAAAFATLVTAKLNLILVASGSATFPFWGPVLQAAARNNSLRRSGRYVGFWRAAVLEVRVERPQRRRYTDATVAPTLARPTVSLLLGDDSGARSQLSLPFSRRYEQIQVGEPAEALVLSNSPRFETFKALKEVYLPVSGLWLAAYPHLNRDVFLDVSLDIERARRREAAEAAEAAIDASAAAAAGQRPPGGT